MPPLQYPVYNLQLKKLLKANGGQYYLPVTYYDGKNLFADTTILLFYTDQCGFCTQFKPVYHRVASAMHTTHPNVTFACINLGEASNPQSIIEKFVGPIDSVPAIFAIKGQDLFQYDERDRRDVTFKNWVIDITSHERI